jgi:hypothetical protein
MKTEDLIEKYLNEGPEFSPEGMLENIVYNVDAATASLKLLLKYIKKDDRAMWIRLKPLLTSLTDINNKISKEAN